MTIRLTFLCLPVCTRSFVAFQLIPEVPAHQAVSLQQARPTSEYDSERTNERVNERTDKTCSSLLCLLQILHRHPLSLPHLPCCRRQPLQPLPTSHGSTLLTTALPLTR